MGTNIEERKEKNFKVNLCEKSIYICWKKVEGGREFE
jgi:hypothetical protein